MPSIPPPFLVPLFSNHLLTPPDTLAGFVRAVQKASNGNGWDHLYQMSYFYGFMVSLTIHALLHYLFPTKRQRGLSPFILEEHAEILKDQEDSSSAAGVAVAATDVEKASRKPGNASG